MNITGIVPESRILKVCAWCPEGKHDQTVRCALEAQGWTFSHGICPACREKFRAVPNPVFFDELAAATRDPGESIITREMAHTPPDVGEVRPILEAEDFSQFGPIEP